jgi:hypothetical protein
MNIVLKFSFYVSNSIGADVWGPPVWEQHPQIEDALPASPLTAVPVPLLAPIWGPPVEMLLGVEEWNMGIWARIPHASQWPYPFRCSAKPVGAIPPLALRSGSRQALQLVR